MAGGALGEEGSERARIRRGHVPAEAARGLADHVGHEHRPHRRLLQVAVAVEGSSLEQHPAEPRQIVRRGKQPGVARHSRQEPRIAVVHDAAKGGTAVDHLGGRDARAPGRRRPEHRRGRGSLGAHD